MSIATRRGDHGQTRLLGGTAVSKSNSRIAASGDLDELNAALGVARAHSSLPRQQQILERLQRDTFVLGAEISSLGAPGRISRVTGAMVRYLDHQVARLEAIPNLLDDWALPGATSSAAFLDLARTVARRAERSVVRLQDEGEELSAHLLRYLNRLSDLLWLLSRESEQAADKPGRLRPPRRA